MIQELRKLKQRFLKHSFWTPLLGTLLVALITSFSFGIVQCLFGNIKFIEVFSLVIECEVFAFFLGYPFVLTIMNLVLMVKRKPNKQERSAGKIVEYATIAYGSVFTCLYLGIKSITFTEWSETLVNSQVHFPISPRWMPTILVILGCAFLGYLILRLVPLESMTPLSVVFSMAAMYLGVGICIAWIVQVFSKDTLLLVLFPCNCILIAIKVVKETVICWNESLKEEFSYKEEFEGLLRILNHTMNWPWVAFLAALPLLGVLILILWLFGQAPDSFIQAFTQTSDWNLSQRVAPQNIMYDEHYLCTVAAGGHKNVVKPIRLGVRHGHEVIVNRQLCVANAFEQIIEEKVPRIHKKVRYIYDTYGYPIARHIHSKFTADVVYFMMKPLEWVFLIVIYLVDRKPENRIAVQYLK